MDEATARGFLAGTQMRLADAMALAERLGEASRISLTRRVFEHMHEAGALVDGPMTHADICAAAQPYAMWTSKDPELPASRRHREAMRILRAAYELDDPAVDVDVEILGTAGGICKRWWQELGQLEDLQRAAGYYERGAVGDLGEDAYAQINAAFLDDVLASLGDAPAQRRPRARALRERIVNELELTGSWWSFASRAEALVGLGRWTEAAATLNSAPTRPALWKLQTTARQLAALCRLHPPALAQQAEFQAFARALLPGAAAATEALTIGKVGLALSGGGFRASFYHLGTLARLAESDMLRHVEVLSCVSGGSIVGACWWLMLRERLQRPEPMERDDYVRLVQQLIDHFTAGVARNPRRGAQNLLEIIWGLARGAHGVLDPRKMATVLDEMFYRTLTQAEIGDRPAQMHELKAQPADHAALAGDGAGEFNPSLHNWLRPHKMPALVINATSANTGHAWQFTCTWMGESPWTANEDTESVQRLEWDYYDADTGWTIDLARAVAASACVPILFDPLTLGTPFGEDVNVQLVDGGVFDNQGTASLLAMNCNVLLVSDACGQLLFESQPQNLNRRNYGVRTMDTLMERVRSAGMSDLFTRQASGQVRRLMVQHMKSGLAAEPRVRTGSQAARTVRHLPFTPCGIRREFQHALAELRTDLDAFTEHERLALMACGYQMAHKGIERDLAGETPLVAPRRQKTDWPFQQALAEITSDAGNTRGRDALLSALRAGRQLKLRQ